MADTLEADIQNRDARYTNPAKQAASAKKAIYDLRQERAVG
jgi:hypothetical protein